MENIPSILFSTVFNNVIKEVVEYLSTNEKILKNLDFNIKKNNFGFNVIYSKKNDNFFVNFNNENSNSYEEVENDQIPMIHVENSSNIRMSQINVNGLKINNGIYLDRKNYYFFLNYPKKFMDSYIYNLTTKIIDLDYKEDKLREFIKLVENNNKELIIDKFIEENPFILELGLQMSNLKHQIVLENIEEKFEQNLKPDVIAYKPLEKRWYIIDYKRSHSRLVKNAGKARSNFRSEVNDLQSQLRDYMNYFNYSSVQRHNFKKKYGIEINKPHSLGIIGYLDESAKNDFEEILEDVPRKYQIIPYNYLIDECKRQLELKRGE